MSARTPDERFETLRDFDFARDYAEVADPTGGEPLRMAYLDEGPRDGEVVLSSTASRRGRTCTAA